MAYGSKSIYGNDMDDTENSDVLKNLKDWMSGTIYFSDAEKSESIMKKTTVKTTGYDGKERSVTEQLYLADAANRDASKNLETRIYIGANNDKEISLLNLIANGGPSGTFWLRSSDCSEELSALCAMSGDRIESRQVDSANYYIVPAFNLNLSEVSFASVATAATSAESGVLAVADAKTYTLRYTPADGSDLAGVSAVINREGNAITMTNAKSGMYLVVQNAAGAYAFPLADDTENVSVDAFGGALTSFNNCKVWMESTTDNLTYAKPAEPSETDDAVSQVKLYRIATPVVGNTLDLTAYCAATGVEETTPAVTWTLGGQNVTGDVQYNSRYQAGVTLTAKEGYVFTEATTATVNSESVITEISADGKTMTIRYTFPRTALKAVDQDAATNYFATKSDLMDSFGLQTGDTVGKIIFGQNGQTGGSAAAQAWKIAGVDTEITEDNVVLFVDNALGEAVFETNWDSKKDYSLEWNCIYPDDTVITQVSPSHYGASELRAKLCGYMQADNTNYFSAAEKAQMNPTKVYTNDANNSNADYYTIDKLYAAQADASNQNYITVGSNIMADKNAGIRIDKNNWYQEGFSWLRSPDDDKDAVTGNAAMCTVPNGAVSIANVDNSYLVAPAFNLKLSEVSFASVAKAAASSESGVLPVSDAKTYTLRYVPAEESDLAKAGAVINKAGNAITVKKAKSGMYLVVQNSEGAYSTSLTNGTKTVLAGDVEINGTALADFSNCKVWIETTTDNLTYAKQAEQSNVEEISEAAITGITAPIVGDTLDLTADCAATGVEEITPVVTWTLGGEDVTGNAVYNRRYQADVTLTAKEGYGFTEATTATVNSESAITEISADGKTMTIRYTFPRTALKAVGQNAATNYFATKADLMESFGLQEKDTIGKIVFGQNGKTDTRAAAQVWEIAGVDEGIAGDNVVLFADSTLGSFSFEYNWKNKKTYSSDWQCTYPDDAVITQVNPNHYGASELRARLSSYMQSDNTNYFSAAEKAQMNPTKVYTNDTNNSNAEYYTTDTLYAAQADSSGQSYITVGSNTMADRNAGIRIDKSNWNERIEDFWLRSPYVEHDYDALFAVPGAGVSHYLSDYFSTIVPAFNLNLSDVSFASAANAASSSESGALPVSDEKAYTLRYTPGNTGETGSALTDAEINREGNQITVTNAKSGMYLVIQKGAGAYEVPLTDGTKTVLAEDVKISGVSSTNFNRCNVWIETTIDNMTYAKQAEPSGIVDISEAAIIDTTAPAAGEALDTTAACTTTGIAETSPVVNWTPEDTTAAYSTAYTASITLTAAENYEFTEDVTATVNGNPASVSLNPNGTITITYTFAKTAEEPKPEPPVTTGTIDLSTGSIANIKAMAYTGNALYPALTVKCGGSKLEEGSDYTVSYENNKDAGTAKVTVTGMGDYYGTLTKEFTINQRALNKSTMEIKDLAATGSALNPAVTLMDGNKELTSGTDYKVAGIKNNTNPGKAQFTLEGIGNYKGTIKGTFQIYEAGVSVLSDCTVTVDETTVPKDGVTYTGKAIKPAVKVTDVSGNEIDKKNYKVTYKKNKNVGTATITIKGKGKTYKGTTIQHFTILPKNIKDIYCIENVTSKTYTGYVVKQNPKVKLLATQTSGKKTLTANTEYVISYTNAVNVGDSAVVTVTGTGNYEGSLTATYAIGKKDISKGIKVASIKAQKYTGLEITPELKVTYGKRVLVKGRDYNVKFANNTDKGKATVTLTGIGNYEGTLNKQFRIK